MSNAEYLRLRLANMPRYVTTTRVHDNSQYTSKLRAMATTIPKRGSDGTGLVYSADVLTTAAAGCAICATEGPVRTYAVAGCGSCA